MLSFQLVLFKSIFPMILIIELHCASYMYMYSSNLKSKMQWWIQDLTLVGRGLCQGGCLMSFHCL